MKKQFVDYEIALVVKELGFDEECLAYYHTPSATFYLSEIGDQLDACKNSLLAGCYISAPLWQQLVDWFREKYKIHISLPNHYDGNCIDIRNFYNDDSYFSLPEKWYENYYEARKQAILKAIELISKK